MRELPKCDRDKKRANAVGNTAPILVGGGTASSLQCVQNAVSAKLNKVTAQESNMCLYSSVSNANEFSLMVVIDLFLNLIACTYIENCTFGRKYKKLAILVSTDSSWVAGGTGIRGKFYYTLLYRILILLTKMGRRKTLLMRKLLNNTANGRENMAKPPEVSKE